MPNRESAADAVLEALGSALFERTDSGALRLATPPPEWLRRCWPALVSGESDVAFNEVSPFLDNFLVDAGECWAAGGDRRVKSGPWVERDEQGAELQLEAMALTARGRALLVVESLGEDFEARRSVLQKARELAITHQRLSAEMQKKEILLHCLAEDLSAALGNIITSLRLMELEPNGTKHKHLLTLATRATEEQQSLIGRVLEVFAEEMGVIYGRAGEHITADLPAVIGRAIAVTAPQFAEKNVRLDPPDAATPSLRITADEAHLERVIINLLENALEYTPLGSDVSVRITDEPDAAMVSVDDGSAEIPPDVRARLFMKFEAASASSPAALLRLHFCRMAVVNWNGEIGHAPLDHGNRFWIRLQKRPPSR